MKGTEEPKQGQFNLSIVPPRNLRNYLEEKKEEDYSDLLSQIRGMIDDAIEGIKAEIFQQIINYINNKTIINYAAVRAVRKATCLANAGAGSTISCSLDTGGTITVNCSVVGGSALNSSVPRLEINDVILVSKISGNWWCLTTFQASEDCACS